jgi:hypothetical protein
MLNIEVLLLATSKRGTVLVFVPVVSLPLEMMKQKKAIKGPRYQHSLRASMAGESRSFPTHKMLLRYWPKINGVITRCCKSHARGFFVFFFCVKVSVMGGARKTSRTLLDLGELNWRSSINQASHRWSKRKPPMETGSAENLLFLFVLAVFCCGNSHEAKNKFHLLLSFPLHRFLFALALVFLLHGGGNLFSERCPSSSKCVRS